jgi:hypothetical protein
VLNVAAALNDDLMVIAFAVFNVANAVAKTGDTMTGSLLLPAGTVSAPALTTSADTNTGIFFPAADTIAFAEGGTEVARFDSSGNFGIGTSSLSQKLDVVGTAAFTYINSTGQGTSGVYFAGNSGSSSVTQFGGELRFSTGGTANTPATSATERARIDSSGALLVGTTTKASEKLDVRGTALGGDTALIQNDNSTTFAASVLALGATRTTTNSTFNFLTCVTQGVAYRLYIRDSGNVQNQNNSYGAISDIKLKENIVDATPKLAKLNQVRVVNYNLIGEGQKQLGVIAQELEQVFPGMVEESPDRDAEGNDLGTTTKSVKYSVFVPMLIKALQEQQQMIETLQAKVAALEAK